MNLYKISDAKTKLVYGEIEEATKLKALFKFLQNAQMKPVLFGGRISFSEQSTNTRFPNGQDSFIVELIEVVEQMCSYDKRDTINRLLGKEPDGLSQAAISRMLGMSRRTVREIEKRALKKLMDGARNSPLLKEFLDGDDASDRT